MKITQTRVASPLASNRYETPPREGGYDRHYWKERALSAGDPLAWLQVAITDDVRGKDFRQQAVRRAAASGDPRVGMGCPKAGSCKSGETVADQLRVDESSLGFWALERAPGARRCDRGGTQGPGGNVMTADVTKSQTLGVRCCGEPPVEGGRASGRWCSRQPHHQHLHADPGREQRPAQNPPEGPAGTHNPTPRRS